MSIRPAIIAAALLAAPAAPAQEEAPLSAIDWLKAEGRDAGQPAGSVAFPDLGLWRPPLAGQSPLTEPRDGVEVRPITGVSIDAAGLLPPRLSGLPADLWVGAAMDEVADAIDRIRPDASPAMRQLYLTLLLAEARPPQLIREEGAFLRHRLERLRDLAAIEPALEMSRLVGPGHPAIFPVHFDLALLAGEVDEACRILAARPALHPDVKARVFCLARTGAWPAALVVLHSAAALGLVDQADTLWLARFLDPELADEIPAPPPSDPTPLDVEIARAVGEPIPTARLPLPFARRDLDGTQGWKAQVEAAERLAAQGVLDPQLLVAIWTTRSPAATGGIWDRVAAVQAVEAALEAADLPRAQKALAEGWPRLSRAGLAPALAAAWAPRLLELAQGPVTDPVTARILMLSPLYAEAAPRIALTAPPWPLVVAAAQGRWSAPGAEAGPLARAVASAFAVPPPAPGLAMRGRAGLGILEAIEAGVAGRSGDARALEKALTGLRGLGLEDAARRLAIEVLLLEPGT